MAEARVSSILILIVVVGLVGFLVLTFGGWLAVGWFNKQTFEDGIAAAKGYKTAKTPGEAMDNFHKAIQNREYGIAASYTTKGYGDQLKRAHANASELGGDIDKIREWGNEKGLLTDKLKMTLHLLDPFPKNFKPGAAPEQKADKAYGMFVWDPLPLSDATTNIREDLKAMDSRMFQNLLSYQAFNGKIELVKEGEVWKLNVPMTPAWEAEVGYFNDRCKTYLTGLNGFWKDVNNQRYSKKAEYEGDILTALRAAK